MLSLMSFGLLGLSGLWYNGVLYIHSMVSFCTSSTATGASSFYPDSMEDRVDSDSGVMRCGL